MQVCYLIKPGVLELRQVPIPEPSHNEVVIKVVSALTDGTDLKAYRRGHPMIPMPGPFGHEYSGVVYAVGKSVRQFKEGDEVMGVHSAPCLSCKMCGLGLFNLCHNIMQSKILGAFAEYLKLPAHVVRTNLFHKPSHISFTNSAMLEPLSCIIHGINLVKSKLQGTALVIGATGAIGLMHIKVLKSLGLTVIASARDEQKLKKALDFGADYIYPYAKLAEILQTDLPDIVFECTGAEEVWSNTVHLVRAGGTVVLFGGCKAGSKACFDTFALHYREITLQGAFHFCPSDVKDAYEMLINGLDLTGLITKTVSLSEIASVFRLLDAGQGIKYEIKPNYC